ncbi:hypothetical protein [Streptomyces sp. NPDC047841]|uniref:hypothetical protein n=1 Tax=Streptomyces sp. NPDC047841 TaxID=3154708 RepID=UPI00345339B1
MTGPIHLYDRYDEPDQLRDQLRRLLRHRAVIALGIVLGLLGGAALALSRAHTYTSTSEVLVRSTADPFGTVSVAADNQVSMGTEQQIAASTAVAVRAARLLGQADGKANALEDALRITNQAKSQVLRFEFTARTPGRAARGANAFAEAYLADRKARNQAAAQRATQGVEQQIKTVEAAQKQETADDDTAKALQSQLDTLRKRVVDINSRDTDGGDVVRRGEPPARPSVPGWPALLALGLAGGAALGILLAWLRSALDTRVRSADEVRAALRTPVLGLLPPGHGEDDDLLAVGRRGGDRAETLRALAYRLRGTGLRGGTGRLLVVSPRRGAATEEVAVNLAAALAECGDEVLLVDADPGTAALTARLPLLPDDARTSGDASSLPDGSSLVDAGSAGRFACCAGGTASPDRTGGPAAVHRLPAGSGSRTTVVVARPLLEHADALALAQRVDGVLLVAGLGTTRRDDLRRAHELVECSGGTLLGTVLDAARRRGRLHAVLRRGPARPEAETATPVVELPAQDDTLSVSRG